MLIFINFAIITELSVIRFLKVRIRMNLHEQCLLRYLQNPDELEYSTEILKLIDDYEDKLDYKELDSLIELLNVNENDIRASIKYYGFVKDAAGNVSVEKTYTIK